MTIVGLDESLKIMNRPDLAQPDPTKPDRDTF